MPELPEVETVCRTLAPRLTGRAFTAFELLWPRTLSSEPGVFAQGIINKTIGGVTRRAKLIRVEFSDQSLITIHLRMTGELLWLAPQEPADEIRHKYLRAEFLLNDGATLLFYDTRKFGRMQYLSPSEAKVLDAYLGIEPLEPEFTPAWLEANLSRRKRQMKPLLLDQQFIAGLGNIYVDEALFAARIHPQTRSDCVTASQSRALHSAIVSTLNGAVERRGTTLRDYRSGLGQSGENRERLLVYGAKSGTPCVRCGNPLQRLVVGQRGTVICPACQSAPDQA